MVKFPLNGGSYTSQSVNADCQTTRNWYPERVESDGRIVLYPSPGLKDWPLMMLLGGVAPIGGISTLIPYTPFSVGTAQYLFAISRGEVPSSAFYGPQLFQIDNNGNTINRAGLTGDGFKPFRFAVGTDNILIAPSSGGTNVNLFTISTSTFAFVPVNFETISAVAYVNGFYLAMATYSGKIYYTLDPATWNGLDFFAVSSVADLNLNIKVDHGELWVFSQLSTQVYNLTGDPDNPFQPNPSGFIQQGIVAPDSLVQLDNTLMWIGGDIRGSGIAWRANGYTPQRISNEAVETAWQSYSTISDAVGFAYQDQGHSFWQINFPTANKTWVYDVAANLWHEKSHLNPVSGLEEVHQAQCHAFFFGKHLVGMRDTPTISEMHIPTADVSGGWNFVTDNGSPIKRTRRASAISSSQKRMNFREIQVYLEAGLGPMPPLIGPIPSSPIDSLFWFNGAAPTFPAADWTFVSVQNNDTSVVQMGTLTIPAGAGINVTLTLPNPYTATGWSVYATRDNWATIYGFAFTGPLIAPATGVNINFGATGDPPSFPFYRAPQLMLRWSNDGAHTWSNEYMIDCGQSGQFSTRVIQRRLGQGRNRVFEISATDPIPWRIIDGFVLAEECDS